MRPLPSGRRASKFDRDFTSVDKLDSFSFKYIKISFATFYFSVFQCREIFYLYQIFSQKATKLLKIQHIRYVRNYRRTGNPRQTRSHPWVKSASSNFARWSESPFVHCTQPYGFACQPLRGLVTSRQRRVINYLQPDWQTSLTAVFRPSMIFLTVRTVHICFSNR